MKFQGDFWVKRHTLIETHLALKDITLAYDFLTLFQMLLSVLDLEIASAVLVIWAFSPVKAAMSLMLGKVFEP